LTHFYDLFRIGLMSWGYNLSNPAPPFMHLTDQDRQTLKQRISHFLIAPGVTGFPFLTLAGQFLLKDLVLFAATVTVIATDAAKERMRQPVSAPRMA